MAWDEATGRALGRSAAFLRRLRTLQPGENIRLPMQEFQDMEFPTPPDERWTWEEKAAWFCARTPFTCLMHEDLESGDWVFRRVKRH